MISAMSFNDHGLVEPSHDCLNPDLHISLILGSIHSALWPIDQLDLLLHRPSAKTPKEYY